jgi:cysteine desulfurase
MSGHKIFGPKGIGFLYKSSMIKITPLLYGSGKYNELNPGTPPLPLIAALSKAIRLANVDLEKKERFVSLINEKIVNELKKYPNIIINKTKYSIPQILNISVMDVMPESLIHALEKHEIYIGTNTACSSGDISSSIMAIYDDQKRAKHTLRISLSHVTTTDEINKFLEKFCEEYEKLGSLK